MDRENGSNAADANCYARSDAIDHWFHGVFEGGGAKGVAFSGALQAMAEKKWLNVVTRSPSQW